MYVSSVSETCQFAEGFESLVITALSEQDGRSYGSAMRAPLFRQECGWLPAAGSSLLPSVACLCACSLMRGLSCQRMIFESADSRLWLMDDLDSSIRLNHGFVAGHFLHPGLLATDHEMRASSSMSSSEMGLGSRAGYRVCGVLPIGWTPDQSKHCSNQNHRMLSTSTFHVHQARINGAYGQPSLRLAMQIPAS